MDAVGRCGVVRPSSDRGVFHRLAAVGLPDAWHCDADGPVRVNERRASGGSSLFRPDRVETADAEPHHSGGDSGQCSLLPHPSHGFAVQSVARGLHGDATLPAFLLVGIPWGATRRHIDANHGRCSRGRHLSDAGRSPRCQILEWLAGTVDRSEHLMAASPGLSGLIMFRVSGNGTV
jgi:hypothetical protein